ncbi:GNAT family N-acetyltransferase [Beijerinckia sp. L45]|uniref:GNAT family N-acetyltransferase n=1 Tax=Beijerinckia sp. L45 TaxID=1641855 RepID=UPI001FF03992|nr:N-acetyltransferase [Beijerinckia sp. L45]
MTLLMNAHRPAAAPFQALPALGLPAPALQAADPITIDVERESDVFAREALLDTAFGPARFRKTCQKLRIGRLPARGLALVARLDGQLVGTVRLWHVMAGGVSALMLGPLAVDSRYREHGIGTRLMDEAILRAKAYGHEAILLVGDAPYYARFGFVRRHTLGLRLPGPVENDRFLGLELQAGALATAKGLVKATGAVAIVSRRPMHQGQRLRRAG